LKPGESGLLALDWWNGNRSILADGHLGGVLLGATLTTRPAEIYRALIEATAFGTRLILENFAQHGVAIKHITATGGLSVRNRLLMQIFADVCGQTIWQCGSDQATALGAAILAASAAGSAGGGYDTLAEATRHMTQPPQFGYQPQPEHQAIYHQLYAEYVRLHDYFGRGENNVLKNLRSLRAQ
jgi:L-ribulokinase